MILAILALLASQENTFDLGGRKVVVKKVDALPYVESDYTKRFTFDAFENPKLKELREK